MLSILLAALFLSAGSLRADRQPEGEAVLAAVRARQADCAALAADYLARYPEALLAAQIRFEWACNVFDDEDYAAAYALFDQVRREDLYADQGAEYAYKKAYCKLALGESQAARFLFNQSVALPSSPYTAPSWYSLGYLYYAGHDFQEAERCFVHSERDWRFEAISAYYILECRFMLKDYRYVAANGASLYETVPEDRRPRLARILSESYLVLGDTGRARAYYEESRPREGARTRADYFYAGSLMYAMEDYAGAVDNFSRMGSRTDSLGQVASYQMGYSYIRLRKKVAALDAFREAAALSYDPAMQEDAYFNYAKLAFDLNHDTSVFNDYLRRYDALKKGDQVYGYIALACLYNHDYEGAVNAFERVGTLDGTMRSNYMKACYLRARQLVEGQSYRKALPYLRSAGRYTARQDPFNQLVRYWMAESSYRDDRFGDALSTWRELYDAGALRGKAEGYLIPYGIAYCYFKQGNYAEAVKWFRTYLDGRQRTYGADAETRVGDCLFYTKRYQEAIQAYERKIDRYPDPNDIYPYYQAGIAKGLIGDRFGKIQILESVKDARTSAPFYSEALYELGRAYVAGGDDKSAEEAFQRLRTVTEDKTYAARALVELGMLSRNAGRYDEALGYYKQVVKAVPGSETAEEALLAIESIYRTREDPDGYIAYVESVGGAGKTDLEKEDMYFNTAEQIFLNENYEKALVTLDSYRRHYPDGPHAAQADFYTAECYRHLGKKEQARDCYRKAIDGGDGSFVELAMLNFAALSYSLEHYDDAYGAYSSLEETARLDNNRYAALVGKMRAAYRGHGYDRAIAAADRLRAEARVTRDDAREADYVKAKSYLATSRRTEAYRILRELAGSPSTAEGAEAAYLIIQDRYDQGDFDAIDDLVYDFSDAAGGQRYWLAKAFIVLGDSFVERGNTVQAEATFESIRDGYTPAPGTTDDIMDQVSMRLSKLR